MKRIIALIAFLLPICLRAQTLHLILIADTQDRYVGKTARKTIDYFKNNFASLLKARMNLQGKINILENTDFESVSITDTNPNDVIVFYYIGHGFNSDGSDDMFPVLEQKYKSILLSDVFNNLKYQSHKLLLVIAEASNTIRKSEISQQTPIIIPGQFPCGENYIVSSSSRGQASYWDELGGLFTQSFFEAFESDTQLLWRNILNNTVSKTERLAREIGVEQTPQWEMN